MHSDIDYIDIFGVQLGYSIRYTGMQIGYGPFESFFADETHLLIIIAYTLYRKWPKIKICVD